MRIIKAFAHNTKILLCLISLLSSIPSSAQDSPEEHEKHHPPSGAANSTPGAPSQAQGGMGGMGEMMKDMMKEMGAPKQKEFYPSLMALPELSEKERTELEEQAHERMKSGAAIMNSALEELTKGAESNNLEKMKAASAHVREGLAQFESGITTHEALSQDDSPQQIGLSWFKKTLSLEEEMDHKSEEGFFSAWGLTPFHFFVMVLLSVFSGAMLLMYFFKMRRAAKLLERLSSSDVLMPTTAALPPTSKKPWKGRLAVSSIYQETPTVKTFKLTTPDHSDLPFTYVAGQFMTLTVVIDGKPIKRAYTIASHPCDKKALDITIKREEHGLVSRYLHDVIHEGDMIELEAAYGNLTFSGVNNEGIVLIGGGVGITPLMSVLRCLIACGMKNEIHLLYACKSLTEFVYRDELKLLQERNPNLKLTVAVDKLEGEFPGAFEGRLTKEKITAAVPNVTKFRVHLCGPPGLMQAVSSILNDLKVPEEQIKTEAFGPAKAPASAAPASVTASAQAVTEPSTAKAVNKVIFRKAGKTVSIQPNETVLELAESSGVDIPYSCRVGTCGACKVKLSTGQVTMEVQDSLTEEDKKSGLILACQAKAQSDLEIEEP